MKKLLFIVSTTLFLAIATTCFAEKDSPELTNVVLYKNGLGYFQIKGKVEGDESFTIPARDTQINDILSSLYVLDLNGGRITSIGYDVKSKNDRNILIKLPQDNSLTGLLRELQGAVIEINSTSDGICTGKLIGLEPVYDIINNTKITNDYKITILGTKNLIKPILLSTVSSYKILSVNLQKDLNKLLDLSLASKYQHRKNITVCTEGKGIRNIVLGYLIDVPVWKSTYRVIFSSENDNEPLIQGYAIAENTTDNDWENIKISFVSGAPLSFIMNLSEPFFVKRPTVPIPGLDFLDVNWNNLTGSELIKGGNKSESKYRNRKSFAAAPAAMEMVYSDSMSQEALDGNNIGQLIGQSNRADSSNSKIGEMFAYNINNKVSILSGHAAMVPIVTEKIKGERIFYFNNSFSDKVSKAFAFKNNTGISFDSGPVTFFQSLNNLGEGIIKEVLSPGSQIVVPYAMAETVSMNSKVYTKKSDYIKGIIVNGLLRLTYTRAKNITWAIENKSSKDEILWIDQPITNGYNLEEPAKPDSIVSENYRFKINLKPQQSNEFKIKEVCTTFDTVSLLNTKADTLLMYSNQGYISNKDKVTLAKISKLLAEKTSLKTTVSQMYKNIKSLTNEQNRLRKNVSMLYNSKNAKEQQLKNKWINKIAESEEKIENFQKAIESSNDLLNKNKRQIAEVIAST